MLGNCEKIDGVFKFLAKNFWASLYNDLKNEFWI